MKLEPLMELLIQIRTCDRQVLNMAVNNFSLPCTCVPTSLVKKWSLFPNPWTWSENLTYFDTEPSFWVAWQLLLFFIWWSRLPQPTEEKHFRYSFSIRNFLKASSEAWPCFFNFLWKSFWSTMFSFEKRRTSYGRHHWAFYPR